MRKLVLPILLAASAQTAMAGPVPQTEGYETTNVASYEVSRIWNQMETDLKGDDCYRRAHIWAFDMYRNDGIKSKKIFIHYTDKWNRQLDSMGRKSWNWFAKKTWSGKGVDKRLKKLVRSNITWDYHVAPMVNVEGNDTVFDRYLALPYDAPAGTHTSAQAWNLKKRTATPEEWVEALTVRGELLWKARRQELAYKLRDTDSSSEANSIRRTMRSLGMTNNTSIDIKCKKVESIAEVDQNHATAWCFWSEAPMYFYNEIDLRYLAYGNTGYRYSMAPPLSVQTEENYQAGRQYKQYRFNQSEIDDAQRERKH